MRLNAVLVLLVAIGSALCWWPLIIEPSLDLPWWVPLLVVGLCCCLATILSEGGLFRFVAASSISTMAGLLFGYMTWPMADGIAQSYAGIATALATGAVAVVSVVAGLVGRWISASNSNGRRAVWIAFAGCVAFGPVVLAVRPPLIALRVARNDRLAAERFEGLKAAVERTRLEAGNPARICEGMTGQALKRNYSGPPFSDKDWHYIAGNYVQADGYTYAMFIDCSHPSHYAIDVRPVRGKADGTRSFCTDETGKVGCNVSWNRIRDECIPCAN
jgi:hypothetical protein